MISLNPPIMRKSLLLLCLILFFSCSPDNENDPEPTPSEANLIKSQKIYAFGVLEEENNYYYNSDGNISKIDINSVYQGTGSFEYFYDANGRMESFSLTLLSPFDDQREEITTLFYEGEKIVRTCTTVSVTNEDGTSMDPTVDKVEYEYNSRGLVTKLIKYDHDYQASATCESLEYIESTTNMQYDSNGNFSRLEDSGNVFGSIYLTYTFDDTFNPFKNIKPVSFRNIYNYSSENNVLMAEEFNSNTNEKVGYVEYNYEFNEDKYPVSITKKWSTADDFMYQTYTYEYTYY